MTMKPTYEIERRIEELKEKADENKFAFVTSGGVGELRTLEAIVADDSVTADDIESVLNANMPVARTLSPTADSQKYGSIRAMRFVLGRE